MDAWWKNPSLFNHGGYGTLIVYACVLTAFKGHVAQREEGILGQPFETTCGRVELRELRKIKRSAGSGFE